MSDDIHEMSAAYVLGALDAVDRATFEVHLQGCGRCQADVVGFAPIPPLLRFLDPAGVTSETADVTDDLVAAIRRDREKVSTRRERWLISTAAIAIVFACAAAVVAIVAATDDEPVFGGPPVALAIESTDGVTGKVTASDRGWGTRVEIDLFDVPDRDGYLLWAVGVDGTWDRSASWGASAEGTCRVVGATRLHLDEIARFVVTSDDKADELVSAFST